VERLKASYQHIRSLVNAGSPRIYRGALGGHAALSFRKKCAVPSVGTRSGKLTVTGYLITEAGKGLEALIVACDCGAVPEYYILASNFRAFKSTRCGICAKKAGNAKRYWQYAEALPDDTHRTRLLNRLSSAISRCHNPANVMYKHYGLRGIKVCAEWRDDRTAFLVYAQTIPGWDNPSLDMDRYDNNRGYEPGNIRFATKSQNAANKRAVENLEARIRELEEENARLRSGKLGAE